MSLLEDGNTADAAVWEDWLDAVEKARNNLDKDAQLRFSS